MTLFSDSFLFCFFFWNLDWKRMRKSPLKILILSISQPKFLQNYRLEFLILPTRSPWSYCCQYWFLFFVKERFVICSINLFCAPLIVTMIRVTFEFFRAAYISLPEHLNLSCFKEVSGTYIVVFRCNLFTFLFSQGGS